MLVLLSACNAENYVKKGDAFFAIGEYYDAAAEYRKAYARTASKDRDKRGERAWKMAECYRRMHFSAKALGAYQNAVRYKYPDSLALLYLAQAQQKMGEYKRAIASYEAFLEKEPGNTIARNGIRGCNLAAEWKNNPTRYTIKKEPVFNGRRFDHSPMLFGDRSDQLYITTTRPTATGDEMSGITGVKSADIFVSTKDDKGKWSQPEMIESEVNSIYDEGACCFSPDGRTMYFTRCTHDPDYPRYAQIYSSNRSDASWGKPELVQISNDTLSSFAHPAVSPDGRWLYFVSDMPGGVGGLDIWRMAMDNYGYGAVENLGPAINSPGDEMFPTFRPNGHLYFSSDGHPGMGGLDIFRAEQDTVSKKWTIENLQAPMNSAGDDFGMTFEGPHNQGYFCSSRGDARGWDHIFSFYCPEVVQTVRGWVYEKDGYELPEAQVYMVGSDGTNQKLSVRGDGSFTQVVKPNVSYIFLGTCKGYLNHQAELNVPLAEESTEYTLQFPLANISAPVLVRNVFYAFDSAELTDDSTNALDSLVALLNENPYITIELSSHCDFRGRDAYNLKLSQRRAESVVNYLIDHGIDSARLTPVGYGEERPKIVTRRAVSEHPFLHEGDTLTEAFITALPDEAQQEACHSLNRRTEFRVLRITYGLFDRIKAKAAEAKEEENEGSPDTDEAIDEAVDDPYDFPF